MMTFSDENSHERMIIWEYEHLGLMPKSNSGKILRKAS